MLPWLPRPGRSRATRAKSLSERRSIVLLTPEERGVVLLRTLCCGLFAAVLAAAPAAAQDASDEMRPALPTFYGDTGLWFVPTAETLPQGRWSTSLFRSNHDRRQGLTDISQIGVTGAFGVTDRLELFTSWRLVRLDRDVVPVFVPTAPGFGGVSHETPFVTRGWSKTLGGPIYAGAKWNLISESRDDAMSFAARLMMKFPSGATWASTNDIDGHFDIIVSREFNDSVELTGTAGAIVRGDPDEFAVSDGAKWGLGATFPSRSALRALVEWEGEFIIKDNVRLLEPPVLGVDGSIAPLLSRIQDPANFKAGLVWQSTGGWFVHGGLNYSRGTEGREIGGIDIDHNSWGVDVRIGFHPGVRRYVPPPPPPPPVVQAAPPPAPPPPPPNRNPIVGPIKCDPCIVAPGQTVQLSVEASDPDSDPLTYRWTAPTGTFSAPNAASTTWTAPQQEGGVPVQVVVSDNKGGSGTSTTTIQVVRPPQKTFTFEDVHFDFDRFTLRPEAVKILDAAIATLRENGDLRLTVEGHTCNIGTAEYNLALGERRANAVRDYLVSRGVAQPRLDTVSYGEERPKHDNSREETRRLNRRAALTVRIQ